MLSYKLNSNYKDKENIFYPFHWGKSSGPTKGYTRVPNANHTKAA